MKYCTVVKIIGRDRPISVGERLCARRLRSAAGLIISGRHILESRCADRCANDVFLTPFRATLKFHGKLGRSSGKWEDHCIVKSFQPMFQGTWKLDKRKEPKLLNFYSAAAEEKTIIPPPPPPPRSTPLGWRVCSFPSIVKFHHPFPLCFPFSPYFL